MVLLSVAVKNNNCACTRDLQNSSILYMLIFFNNNVFTLSDFDSMHILTF